MLPRLPADILIHIATWLHPTDVACISSSFRGSNAILRSNVLWRALYRQQFSVPRVHFVGVTRPVLTAHSETSWKKAFAIKQHREEIRKINGYKRRGGTLDRHIRAMTALLQESASRLKDAQQNFKAVSAKLKRLQRLRFVDSYPSVTLYSFAYE